MWLGSTEALRAELLDLVSEMFSEATKKTPSASRQIRERLKQHSLIANAEGTTHLFAFDHDDFRQFFLGEALGKVLVSGPAAVIQAMLRVGTLPGHACDAAVQFVRRMGASMPPLVESLERISRSEVPTSFTRENCGALLIRMVDKEAVQGVRIGDVAFPPDALRGRRLRDLRFCGCYFQSTSLEHAIWADVSFSDCHFDDLEVSETTQATNCSLERCDIVAASPGGGDARYFDPESIRKVLESVGFRIAEPARQLERDAAIDPDDETGVTERVIRVFLRASHVNLDVFRLRLGSKMNLFTTAVLPDLLRVGVLEETQYAGSGRGRRFRLAVPMQQIERAMREARGVFRSFIAFFE
jgi:hypothetical protein